MAQGCELLVSRCCQEDVAVLERVCGPDGPTVRTVKSPLHMAHQAVTGRPVAVVLGIGRHTRARLDVIPVIRAVWKELPVIVIADEDSLSLEKAARQAGIFYYFVHPLEGSEVEAVLDGLLHRGPGLSSGIQPRGLPGMERKE